MTFLSRRRFLQGAAAAAFAPALAADAPLPRVAAIFTEFRYRSHAHVILENFLEPFVFNGKWTEPAARIVSFYADQLPEKEMARDVAKEYRIPLYKSIGEALTLGGKELAVDAVLSIGEHGKYPINARGVPEYPRKR